MEYRENIFAQQARCQTHIEEQCNAHFYDISDPLVIVNPYKITPLSALICFETTQSEDFFIELYDNNGRRFLSYHTEPALKQRLPIVALIENSTTLVKACGSKGSLLSIEIISPEIEHIVELSMDQTSTCEELLFFLPADGVTEIVGFNRFGECCWLCTLPWSHRIELLENGHFLCGAPYQLAPPYSGTALWEIDALGHVYKEYRFEDGCSGDFTVLDDNFIVAITQLANHGTARDVLVWIDRENGQVVKRFFAKDFLPSFNGSAGQSGTDWFQGNQVFYQKEEKLLYWSGLAHNIILVLDAVHGTLKQIIGKNHGWKEKVDNMLFKPLIAENVLEEPYGIYVESHYIYYMNAHRYPEGRKGYPEPVDLIRMNLLTGDIVPWFVLPFEVISPVFNDVVKLPCERYGILAGGISDTTSMVPAFFAREQQPQVYCESRLFIYQEQMLLQIYHINVNCKAICAWNSSFLKNGSTQQINGILGSWRHHLEIDIELPVKEVEWLEDDFPIHFWQDDARLYVKATFYQGEMTVLILERDGEKHQFFIQSNRKPFGSEWTHTYTGGPERQVYWAIPITHLVGKWNISLLIDETLYRTNEYVCINEPRDNLF